MFDTKIETWITDPSLPELCTARLFHASCSTEERVFVFGGAKSVSCTKGLFNTIEILDLQKKPDNSLYFSSQWVEIKIESLEPRIFPLMKKLDDSTVLILGGGRYDNKGLKSDGILFDTEKLKTKQVLKESQFRFISFGGNSCVSKHGTITAIVKDVNH